MATKTKIFLRIALVGGVGYIIYRNRDKIIGKVSKLSRMDDVEDIIDDLSKTTNNVLNGIIDSVEDLYEYVTGTEAERNEPVNEALQNELSSIASDLPLPYATQLRNMAQRLVIDINEWNNPEYDYQGSYTQKGKMAGQSFINWHNYFSLKGKGDFERVTKMANTMLQYKYPKGIDSETVRDSSLPTIEQYVANPPKKFTQLNDVDWGNYQDGKSPNKYSLKPRDLFRVIGDKLRNEGLVGGTNKGLGGMTFTPQKPTVVFGRN